MNDESLVDNTSESEERVDALEEFQSLVFFADPAERGVPAYRGQLFKPTLTKTQLDILKYLAAGYTRKEIAERKHRAIGTLDKHINTIIQKLRAKNVTHAVVLALMWRIIE